MFFCSPPPSPLLWTLSIWCPCNIVCYKAWIILNVQTGDFLIQIASKLRYHLFSCSVSLLANVEKCFLPVNSSQINSNIVKNNFTKLMIWDFCVCYCLVAFILRILAVQIKGCCLSFLAATFENLSWDLLIKPSSVYSLCYYHSRNAQCSKVCSYFFPKSCQNVEVQHVHLICSSLNKQTFKIQNFIKWKLGISCCHDHRIIIES